MLVPGEARGAEEPTTAAPTLPPELGGSNPEQCAAWIDYIPFSNVQSVLLPPARCKRSPGWVIHRAACHWNSRYNHFPRGCPVQCTASSLLIHSTTCGSTGLYIPSHCPSGYALECLGCRTIQPGRPPHLLLLGGVRLEWTSIPAWIHRSHSASEMVVHHRYWPWRSRSSKHDWRVLPAGARTSHHSATIGLV